MNIETLYNHVKQNITHIHLVKSKLTKPTFFYETLEILNKEFKKQEPIVSQYHAKQYASKQHQLEYQKNLTKLNNINADMKVMTEKVQTEIGASNQIIHGADLDIQNLENLIYKLKNKDNGSDMDAATEKSVNDYNTLYSNKIYVFFIYLIFTGVIYSFFYSFKIFLYNLVFIIVYYILKFIYWRYLSILFLPDGPSSVDVITDSSGVVLEPTSSTTISEYCMGPQCCGTNSTWVDGQGCIESTS